MSNEQLAKKIAYLHYSVCGEDEVTADVVNLIEDINYELEQYKFELKKENEDLLKTLQFYATADSVSRDKDNGYKACQVFIKLGLMDDV